MYVWHWRQLPPLPVDDERHYIYISAQCYALLHGHGGDEDDTRSRSDTICVSLSRLCAKRAGSAPTGTGTYCFDNGTGEWTKAGNWRLPFWSHVLHVLELGDGLLFGIENKHHHRFCVMDISGATKTSRAPVRQHAWVDIDPSPNWNPYSWSVAYLGDGQFCIHRSFDVMEEDGYGSGGYDSINTVDLLTGRHGGRASRIQASDGQAQVQTP